MGRGTGRWPVGTVLTAVLLVVTGCRGAEDEPLVAKATPGSPSRPTSSGPVATRSAPTKTSSPSGPASIDLFACQAAVRVERALNHDQSAVNRAVETLGKAQVDVIDRDLSRSISGFLHAYARQDPQDTAANFSRILAVCASLD